MMLIIIVMSIIYIVYIQRHQKLGYVSQYEAKHNEQKLFFCHVIFTNSHDHSGLVYMCVWTGLLCF